MQPVDSTDLYSLWRRVREPGKECLYASQCDLSLFVNFTTTHRIPKQASGAHDGVGTSLLFEAFTVIVSPYVTVRKHWNRAPGCLNREFNGR